MNVVLIGFRCTGKTSVGKLLSKKLHMDFVDTDDQIEKEAESTIKDIFDTRGESWFRMLESDVIGKVSKLDNTVISTGGGMILHYKNIRNLKRKGVFVLLQSDAITICERIKTNERTPTQRPPLTNKDLLTEVNEQLQYRKTYYLQAADFILNTTNKKLDDIVEEICSLLKATGGLKT